MRWAALSPVLALLRTSRSIEGLSYSNRLRLVLAIEGAKTAETRERRIAKTVSGLHEGKA